MGRKILFIIVLFIYASNIFPVCADDDVRWSALQWDKLSRELFLSGYNPFIIHSIFVTALELEIFPTLGSRWLSAEQVAGLLNTNATATEYLLNCLVEMEFLVKKKNLFANAERTLELFGVKTAEREAQIRRIIANRKLWGNLTEGIKSGSLDSEATVYPVDDTLFMYAIKSDADLIASALDLSGTNTILDLGGGCGYYAIEFVRRYPHLKTVVFDINENFLKIAEESAEKHKLKDRITIKQGDFFKDDFGGEYDMVFIAFILHMFKEDLSLALLRRAKQSLSRGGRIVIYDFFIDDTITKMERGKEYIAGTIMQLYFLLRGFTNCQVHTYSEVQNWLISLGFKNVKRISNLGLIIAQN